jgi:chromate transporter
MFPLGFCTYGGPLAHIAILKQRFVDERAWVTEEEFKELFALC